MESERDHPTCTKVVLLDHGIDNMVRTLWDPSLTYFHRLVATVQSRQRDPLSCCSTQLGFFDLILMHCAERATSGSELNHVIERCLPRRV